MAYKKKENPKNNWWRPSKAELFLEWMKQVLNEGINAIILTDEELFIDTNDKLEKDNRICYTTFKNYKASAIREESELYEEFLSVYKKALLKQKRNLFIKLQWDEAQWQKYAWIIERKFNEWNLKKISESTVKVQDYTFTSNLESD